MSRREKFKEWASEKTGIYISPEDLKGAVRKGKTTEELETDIQSCKKITNEVAGRFETPNIDKKTVFYGCLLGKLRGKTKDEIILDLQDRGIIP